MKSLMDNFVNNGNCHHNHDSLKTRIRYYTPQPFLASHQDYESETLRRISSKRCTSDADCKRQDCTADQEVQSYESKAVSCFKGLFEPRRAIKDVLRTQTLLRRCYTPSPNVDAYRTLEIESPGKRIPQDTTSMTVGPYRSGTQSILKQHSSSLSKSSSLQFHNDKIPVIFKSIKQRPKLQIPIETKQDVSPGPEVANPPSPNLISRAEAEIKNFLYDLYLKKAEECLENYEHRKESMDLSECLRQLDRCIEFYELALKTLEGKRDQENSKILLRAKQSKIILKKRNIWRLKHACLRGRGDNQESFRQKRSTVTEQVQTTAVSNANDCRKTVYCPSKTKICLNREEPVNVRRRSAPVSSTTKCPEKTKSSTMVKRKLPQAPQRKTQPYFDISERADSTGHSFIKISLV